MSNKIVFFGSGPVAAASLKLLAESFEIEAVVTKPRPAHHRGDTPVVDLAQELNLPLLEAANRTELDNLFSSLALTSSVAVLIDFGIIVSQKIIDFFPLGIVNSHFSLLPEWRGADPISFAILSGQSRTGVSLMLLMEAMDEGPLLGYATCDLNGTETTPGLTDELILLSYELLKELLPLYIAGELQPTPQDASISPTYSRKLTKDDSQLDFTKPATELERQVRAFGGWPRSRTTINGTEVVVTEAHVTDTAGKAGELYVHEKEIGIHCVEGTLILDKLLPAGKKEMTSEAFLAGYKIP